MSCVVSWACFSRFAKYLVKPSYAFYYLEIDIKGPNTVLILSGVNLDSSMEGNKYSYITMDLHDVSPDLQHCKSSTVELRR